MRPATAALAGLLWLAGCSDPLPVSGFGDQKPLLDPVAFFTGPIRSWGVLEDRSGAPTSIVTTDGTGVVEGRDGVRFLQQVHVGTDTPVVRDWHMRRVGPGRFEATANDMIGVARGQAAGNAFHWTWTLALHPGNPFTDVTMDQWWYLQADGSILNRTVIRKLGITLAEVTEHFIRGS